MKQYFLIPFAVLIFATCKNKEAQRSPPYGLSTDSLNLQNYKNKPNSNLTPNSNFYGKWKCVKLDTRGYQKYTFKQAKELQASILTIEKNTYYYRDIKFIDKCVFFGWKITSYDTSNLEGNVLDVTYTKEELAKFKKIDAVDSTGEDACYNDCAIFYLKQDTLINICGGYTLYFFKVDKE